MRTLSKDYVVQEVLDTIALKQLNKEHIPELSGDRIEAIADSIIFDWNELGDPEADFAEMVKWNLEQNLTHW
jgi:hypothetical protein